MRRILLEGLATTVRHVFSLLKALWVLLVTLIVFSDILDIASEGSYGPVIFLATGILIAASVFLPKKSK